MSNASPLSRNRGRPRKSPEEMAHLHNALIRAGLVVLTEKGFSAVGIDEILRLAGVPKGSFYAYYDSKEAFGRALIDAYAGYFAAKLDRWFLDEALTPLARLHAFVEDAKAGMARHGFTRGCLVGNLGQEMGTLPPSFRRQLTDVLLDWQARTATCLRAAQAAGEIGPEADCDQLAEIFWIGWEGAVLRAKLELSPAPLDTFAAGFLAMLR
ncbi:TetR/AcrR family transcriptional regulator [Sedimentimonas flavescens]|uniref:TetR/AcrR family transcriptional regulator n=2 Tax=Sedimentimonas flavescens TaxID=2851012 RepID=A0ABT2ZVF2_9RHOB|nr:TetR/AcrR family transcriptional regulator [Sedimentimonas flavescens]WBL34068.1 TetR/AcrR family transcriptional regulator [Sinirhodobacter sp. HNIBRBA609]